MIEYINISNGTDLPIYEQIYNQIVARILKGDLKPHTALPSIRTAARELSVSIITITRTWDDLEKDGYIYTLAGKGSFVSEFNQTTILEKKNQILNQRLILDLNYYKELGITKEALIEMIEKAFKNSK